MQLKIILPQADLVRWPLVGKMFPNRVIFPKLYQIPMKRLHFPLSSYLQIYKNDFIYFPIKTLKSVVCVCVCVHLTTLNHIWFGLIFARFFQINRNIIQKSFEKLIISKMWIRVLDDRRTMWTLFLSFSFQYRLNNTFITSNCHGQNVTTLSSYLFIVNVHILPKMKNLKSFQFEAKQTNYEKANFTSNFKRLGRTREK